MINVCKMELFRLFKTRSLYVILAIMAAMTVFFTYIVKDTFNQANNAAEAARTEAAKQDTNSGHSDLSDGFETGLQVQIVSPNTDEKSSAFITAGPSGAEDISEDDVSILSMLYNSVTGLLMGLYVVIFAVLFATADTTSGFIKNIGGQVSSRTILILSKALCLFVYTVVIFAAYLAFQGISTQAFFGYSKLGDIGELASYLVIQILLHFALALFGMMLAILIKNNLVSIIIVILLCAEIPTVLFRIINQLIGNLGIENFDISKYSLTGNISALETSVAGSDLTRAVCVGICFTVFSVLLSCFIFKKRDIV